MNNNENPATTRTELDNEEIRPEYDASVLKNGVRGRFYAQYQQSTNLALLEPELRAAFPTDEAVNEALRLLVRLAQQSVSQTHG